MQSKNSPSRNYPGKGKLRIYQGGKALWKEHKVLNNTNRDGSLTPLCNKAYDFKEVFHLLFLVPKCVRGRDCTLSLWEDEGFFILTLPKLQGSTQKLSAKHRILQAPVSPLKDLPTSLSLRCVYKGQTHGAFYTHIPDFSAWRKKAHFLQEWLFSTTW